MKIAFISYELPPDTHFGGVGTYVNQAATMLARRGHHVEVIAGSTGGEGTSNQSGYTVHRVAGDRSVFAAPAGRVFSLRHAAVKFDVLEGPEFEAEARDALRLVGDIPFVVKLHTPRALLRQLDFTELGWYRRMRIWFGAKRRGTVPPWITESAGDYELQHVREADEIAAPSRAIVRRLSRFWKLDNDRISVYPYPFEPPDSLLQIPVESGGRFVTFIGRLEGRKGVTDIASAVPLIAADHPDVRFRFVGRDTELGDRSATMSQIMKRIMGTASEKAEFIPHVPAASLPDILREASICLFPSRWENYPNVCLEAMFAGRAIVGSSAGGMEEMLDGGSCGVLVPPSNAKALAAAVHDLLRDPNRRRALGEKARLNAVESHSYGVIGPLQEASYCRAIARRKSVGCRNAQ